MRSTNDKFHSIGHKIRFKINNVNKEIIRYVKNFILALLLKKESAKSKGNIFIKPKIASTPELRKRLPFL